MKGHYEVKTNKKGEYFYMGIPAGGKYKIELYMSGKKEGTPTDMVNIPRLAMGDPMTNDFDLSQMAARRAAMTKAVDSGQAPPELSREMSAADKAQMEKVMKDRAAAMQKNKALQESFNNGMTALQAKDFQAAIDNFKKAGEIDPKQPVIWGNAAEAYMGIAKSKNGAEKDEALNAAVENYNKALELKPDDAGMHNNLALALAQMKKFPESKAELEKAAALDPPSAGKYYYNLGAILTNTGQTEPALEAFRKAIDLTPNYADAHYQYAVALSAKMQVQPDGKVIAPPGMNEELQKYLELAPDGPNAQAAKDLMAASGGAIQTKYVNPDAGKKKSKK